MSYPGYDKKKSASQREKLGLDLAMVEAWRNILELV
jgi:hypothetical protein